MRNIIYGTYVHATKKEIQKNITSDGLGTTDALLGKEVAKAVSTVGLVLTGCKLLPRQDLVAVGAGEALLMPGGALVCDATLVDHL